MPRSLVLCGIPRSLDSQPRHKVPFGVVGVKGLVESPVTLGRPLDSIQLSHRGVLLPASPRLVQRLLRYLDDLTLSMTRPTSICIGPGGEGWSAVVPIGIVLPNCAMINQEVIVTITFSEWRRCGVEGIINELEYPCVYC